jgi:hypothetical protein
MIINTNPTPLFASVTEPSETDVNVQMAYVAQQRLDGYAAAVEHAIKRKSSFDKRLKKSRKGEVTFAKGTLVQIYRSDMDNNHKSIRKLIPKWSPPHRVVKCLVNSYRLETLNGDELEGLYSSRRLRRFTPRQGTRLAAQQAELETRLRAEEEEEDWIDEETIEKLGDEDVLEVDERRGRRSNF